MTLSRIRATNFKCFRELDLVLGKLTLLTGYNGAGKSTALQPLLLMSQSLRAPDYDPEFRALRLKGSLVNLGSVGEVIRRDGASEPVSFGFENTLNEKCDWEFVRGRESDNHELLLECFHLSGGNSKNREDQASSPSVVETIGKTIFISAIRKLDPETFGSPPNSDELLMIGDVGTRGEYAPYWYSQQTDAEVDKRRRHLEAQEAATVTAQISAWIKDLFEGALFKVTNVDKTQFTLRFAIGPDLNWRRPSNVGFGLSYAFPIITALVCSKPGQVIVIDSPEAHLHPSAQSKFGEILMHFARAGVQILVESHSDHLLSGIRLAVHKGAAAPEDLAIYFFKGISSSDEDSFVRIGIETSGDLTNWPDGFFDQAVKDLMELA